MSGIRDNWGWAKGRILGGGEEAEAVAKRRKRNTYRRQRYMSQVDYVVEWCKTCGEAIPPGASHHRDGIFKQVPGGEKGEKSNKTCLACSPRS